MSLLHIGDIISLYSNGFLSTLGLIDDRCVLQPAKDNEGTLKNPPKKFRDCLFKVCIQHKYDVQGELWRSGHLDDELYKKLYAAAKSEQETNQEKNRQKRGTVVRYEDTVQLLHIKSNKYITVNAKASAPEDKEATRVYLDSSGNEGSWLKVKSPYKYRSNGEDVVCESIALVSDIMGVLRQEDALYLHASSLCLADNPDCLEINANRRSTSWDVRPFLDYTEDLEDFLKGGDVVRLFHTDQEKFLTMDTYNNELQHVFLRSTDRAKATSATSSKALWEVEVVQQDPCRASLARWASLIRLKHLATERFLAADQDDDKEADPMREKLREKELPVYKLISIDFSYDYSTLFEFDSTTMNVDADDYIPIHSNVTLKHFATSTYVHSTSIYIDNKEKKSCMSKVGCAQKKGLDEVFAVIPVSATEIRDLDFVYDACLLLNEAHELIRDEQQELGRLEAHRKLADLLPELIHFIANKENEPHKVEKALTMSAENPNRERQKLLREQNVLNLLFAILKLENKLEANVEICRLCYRVLRLSFQDYRKNQEYVVEWASTMQEQFGKEIFAESTYSALFHSNKNLLEKSVVASDIERFVQLIKEKRQSSFLKCLSDLCISSNGSVSAQTQKLVCESILADSSRQILIETRFDQSTIMLSTDHWTLYEDSPLARNTCGVIKPLKEIVMAAKNGYETDLFLMDYYRHQLDLLGAICQSRQYRAISVLSSLLPLWLVQRCVSDTELPCELRASFCRLLLHLHLNREPQQWSSPVSLRRDWLEVPEKISVQIYDSHEQRRRQLWSGADFGQTGEFVELYLNELTNLSSVFQSNERNKLTYEVINLNRELTYFGFYRLSDFLRLGDILLLVLEDDKSQQQALVMRTKTKIIETLQYMSEVRLDYMLTSLLAIFKCNLELGARGHSASQIAIKANQTLDEHLTELNLDSSHGRKFVEVLLRLVRHDCPNLVSASLKLLLNYRSQRHRILETFRKIELEGASAVIVDEFHRLHPLIERSDKYIRRGRDDNQAAVNEVLLRDSTLISYIVQHVQYLIRNKDEERLTSNLLRLLRDLIPLEGGAGRAGRAETSANQAAGSASSAGRRQEAGAAGQTGVQSGPPAASLADIQNKLEAQGAASLVVELIGMGSSGCEERVRERSAAVFKETLALAIGLLEAGNQLVQSSIHEKLTRKSEQEKSERFFEVLASRMSLAQQALSPAGSKSAEQAAWRQQQPPARLKRSNLMMQPREDTSSLSLDCTASSSPRLLRQASLSGGPGERALLTEELRADLEQTIENTGQALAITRQGQQQQQQSASLESHLPPARLGTDSGYSATPTPLDDSGSADEEGGPSRRVSGACQVPEVIKIMRPVLRFLQLLCEDHNLTMQNYMHSQGNKQKHNLVAKTLVFLNCLCGSKEGSLGHKLGEYIKESNVDLINQTLRTLTEYCQGPCVDNQRCILMHESNGIDMIRSLILDNIEPLDNLRMDLVLELKDNASKLLLALMESCADPNHAARILREPTLTRKLIEVAISYYHEQDDYDDSFAELSSEEVLSSSDGMVRPRDVGHKIFILCHQLVQQYNLMPALHLPPAKIPSSQEALQAANSELASSSGGRRAQAAQLSSKDGRLREAIALAYYESHTAQIEIVRGDRQMERVVFQVPQICEYLTHETKLGVYHNTEQDERGSKIPHFFQSIENLFDEMKWQRELQTKPILHSIARYMSLWSSVEFRLSCLVTVLVLFCVSKLSADQQQASQQQQQVPDEPSQLASLLSTLMAIGLSTLFMLRPRLPYSWSLLLTCATLYLAQVLGAAASLKLLGLLLESVSLMHLTSVLINRGIINKPLQTSLLEPEVIYHASYLLICTLGLLLNPLFYPFLLPPSLIRREETLRNVIKSVTKNAYSILMTGFLGLIIILLYTIIDYLFFGQDFVIELHDGAHYKPCLATLWECYLAHVNYGLRDGGGIGDRIRDTRLHLTLLSALRLLCIMSFFLVVNLMILQLVYCIIVDTFATLRGEKQQKEEVLRNSCFVCGLERSNFENRQVTFEEHIQTEHNLWHYLYFIVLIKTKSRTELSGPESYVHEMLRNKDHSWFPRMRAMSLSTDL